MQSFKVRFCVYTITCPISNSIIYIGSTFAPNSRFKNHLNNKKSEIGKYLQFILSAGMEPIFKIVKSFADRLSMLNYESILIAKKSKKFSLLNSHFNPIKPTRLTTHKNLKEKK